MRTPTRPDVDRMWRARSKASPAPVPSRYYAWPLAVGPLVVLVTLLVGAMMLLRKARKRAAPDEAAVEKAKKRATLISLGQLIEPLTEPKHL